MLNVPQFQRAAKDFRAGKIDIQQFTKLVYAASEPDLQTPAVQTTPAQATGNADETRFGERGRPTPEVLVTDELVTSRLNLDLDRARRCGFSEVIYAPGKTTQDLKNACDRLLSERQHVLITRLESAQAEELSKTFPSAVSNTTAKTFRIAATQGGRPTSDHVQRIAVVTAGTGDIPVAEEAAETLRWMGWEPRMIYDVGVAGPHRLVAHLDFLKSCAVVIVIAGMEGALPSVVGGHVACPVIAVPTSMGYGSNFQGLVPMLAMMNSCAANVIAVNIDAGFKGGYIAGLILAQARYSA